MSRDDGRVVGSERRRREAPAMGFRRGRSAASLAAADDPLRRRTAITAPLWFVRHGDDAHLAELFSLAAVLAADPEPVVHHAVGIALKHAGGRDPRRVVTFLDRFVGTLPRAALRSAVDKLDPHERGRYVR